MEFTDLIKGDLEKRYATILAQTGESVSNDVQGIEVRSEAALARYASFKKRQIEENNAFNKALSTIQENKEERLKKEKEDEQIKAENARRYAEAQAEKWKGRFGSFEGAIQYISLFVPALFAIINGIILFANATQLKMRGAFTGLLTGWIFFVIGVIPLTTIFCCKRHNDWDRDDWQARLTSGIFTAASIAALIITICVSSSNIKANFEPETFMSVKATGKTTSKESSYLYTTISFSIKNTSDIAVDSFKGNMDFYKKGSLLSKYTVTFNGTFSAGASYTSTVDFQEDSSNPILYNVSFSSLTIKWKITNIRTTGGPFDLDGPVVTL